MSQTTTPSGADVDPLAVMDLDRLHAASWRGISMDRSLRNQLANESSAARTAVAALIARNAELEAERDALVAWKVVAWQARDERDAETKRAATLITERDALAAENKALRETGKVIRDALEWYASDPRVWVSFAPKEYEKDFSAAMASPYLTRIEDDERGHPQFVPNERKAEEAIADVDAALARTPAATGGA